MRRVDFTRWFKRQLRGMGSLVAASGIVLGVLSFAMISLAAPDAEKPVYSSDALTESAVALIEGAQSTLPSLYIKALTDKPISLMAEIEVHGWKDKGQRIVDARIGSIEPLLSVVRANANASAYPAGQITEQLSGQRVLASVSVAAADMLPASGSAKVALIVTPAGETATLVIDEVIAPTKRDGGLRDGSAETVESVGVQSVSGLAASPRVDSLSRYWGPPGTKVTLVGTGFGRTMSTSWVTCAGSKARVLSWSDKKIVFRIPSGMKKQGYIGVVKKKRPTNGLYFSPFTPPAITSITPREGAPGTVVTLRGVGFGSKQKDGWVTFSGSTAQVTSWSDTKIKVIVPRDATSGYAGVVAHGMTSNGVLYGPLGSPLVASLSSRVLIPGRTVAIRGRAFGNRTGSIVVGGVRIAPSYWSPTEVRFTVAQGLKGGYVGVIRGDSWTSNGVWAPSAPRLDSISSWWSRPAGTLTITGVGFGATRGDKSVYLKGTEMAVKSWSENSITIEVPSTVSAGYVGVGTRSACSNGIYLIVETPATISSASPRSVTQGDRVTITGSGFGDSCATSKVYLGGKAECTAISWTDTQIVVSMPPLTQTTYIGVVKNGVSSNGFWVTPRLVD